MLAPFSANISLHPQYYCSTCLLHLQQHFIPRCKDKQGNSHDLISLIKPFSFFCPLRGDLSVLASYMGPHKRKIWSPIRSTASSNNCHRLFLTFQVSIFHFSRSSRSKQREEMALGPAPKTLGKAYLSGVCGWLLVASCLCSLDGKDGDMRLLLFFSKEALNRKECLSCLTKPMQFRLCTAIGAHDPQKSGHS